MFSFKRFLLKSYPKNLLFIVTHNCNARCIMCNIWRDDKKDEMSLENIENVFNQKIFSRLQAITFSGGEASLRIDFEDIVKYFLNSKKNLNNIMIATNSLAPQLVFGRVERILEHITKNVLNVELTVQISCDGVGETADVVRGTPGAFQRINSLIDQLNNLKKEYSNLKIKIFFLALPQNLEELDKIADYAEQKKIDYQVSHLFISGDYYQNNTNKDNLVFSEEQTRKIINFLKKQKVRGLVNNYYKNLVRNMYCGYERRGDCAFLAPKNILIEANGDAYFCMNSQGYKLGNVMSDFGKNFWQSKEYKKIRKSVMKNCCRYCKNNCGFSPKGFALNFLRIFFKVRLD